MSLRVATAPFRYRGPDRFDVTRKTGGPKGHPFAPSWRILMPALNAMREARRVRSAELESKAWETYAVAFMAEMAASAKTHAEAWRDLLARERAVLVCYCAKRERCHRGLLVDLLVNLGAVDEGEVTT